MHTERIMLPASDGTPIALHTWTPTLAPRGVVVIAHGMAEHAARYSRIACALVGAGYAVLAPDHRGHGGTAATRDAQGHLDEGDWARMVDDLHLVVLRARAEHPGAPVMLLGHSMGSFLARSYAIQLGETIDGLILSGTASDPGALGRAGLAIAKTERRLRGASARSPLLDKLSFGAYNKAFAPNRTDFDWLSRDDAQVDAYVDDPDCGFVCTTGFYNELFTALADINDPAQVARVPSDLSVLVISGDADPVGSNGAGPRYVASQLRAAGLTDVSVRTYPGARHELFNETNHAEVTEEVLDWLDARIPERVA